MALKRQAKYLLALLLFGSNGVIADHISLSSYEIVLLRTLIGSLLLVAVFALSRKRAVVRKHPRDALFIAISGAAMGVSWMLLYEAYTQIGVSLASLLYYCGPVLVMALSPLLFSERLTATRLLGFGAVFAGVICVNGQALAAGASVWGLACGVLSAVAYALMVVANKKARAVTGIENATLQLLVSFAAVAVFVLCKDGIAMRVAPGDWGWILVLGLLNTGVGCYFYFSSIGALPVQTVAVCGYLEPLAAVVFAVLFLGEVLRPTQILGAALILGGAIFSECAGRKRAQVAEK